MKILAIDPATTTGWAHSNGESGTWDFTLKKDESVGMKFLRLSWKLQMIYETHGVDMVAYEVPRGFGHHNALVSHSKFCGAIERFCAEYNIPSVGYVATAIKKHATLNGKAKKEEMVSRAKIKFKIDIIDDNHADALWLLDLAQKDLG